MVGWLHVAYRLKNTGKQRAAKIITYNKPHSIKPNVFFIKVSPFPIGMLIFITSYIFIL